MRRRSSTAGDESVRRRPDAPVEAGAVPPGVKGPELDAAYTLLASDRDRERQALGWSEALTGDGDPLRR